MEMLAALIPALLLWIVYGVITHSLAGRKGYHGFKWGFLSWCPLLNFITAPYVMGLPDLVVRDLVLQLARERERRACPFCAEAIMREAIVCKHCGRDVPKAPVTSSVMPGAGSPVGEVPPA